MRASFLGRVFFLTYFSRRDNGRSECFDHRFVRRGVSRAHEAVVLRAKREEPPWHMHEFRKIVVLRAKGEYLYLKVDF